MLYSYTYIHRHEIHKLNQNLFYFFRKIRGIKTINVFDNNVYFAPDFAADLNNSPVLSAKFAAFFDTFKGLNENDQDKFYKKVLESLSVGEFFENGAVKCKNLNTNAIKKILKNDSLNDLANYLFTTTIKSAKWKIKDHYLKLYEYMPDHKTCPFCGVGEMHKSFREDYDHLAPKKHYPLFAINLKNLVPMCSTCNSKFKGQIDVFYKGNRRRTIAYPYKTSLKVELDYSKSIIPETDIKKPKGRWAISFVPNNHQNNAWAEIFSIEKRYVEDYIEPKFELWLELFVDDMIDSGLNALDTKTLQNELNNASVRYAKRRFIHTNIIKAPLFNFLAECENSVFYNSIIRSFTGKINKIMLHEN